MPRRHFGNHSSNALTSAFGGEMSLADQHLNHALAVDMNRALITRQAMGNAEFLLEYGKTIVSRNPEAAPMFNQIMSAYVNAASECIYQYGIAKKEV